MPDAQATPEQQLKERDKIISLLVTRLAGVETCMAAAKQVITTEHAFSDTEACQTLARLVDRSYSIAFAGCPRSDVDEACTTAILESRSIALVASHDKLGSYKLAETPVYKGFRRLISRWAGGKLNGG